jgi:hypothetical protein
LGQNIFKQAGGGGGNYDGFFLFAFTDLKRKPPPFVSMAGKNALGSLGKAKIV